MYFDRTYYLSPANTVAQRRPYVLLLEALKDSGMAAVGRFVLRGQETFCLIRPRGEALALETLFLAEDVRSQAEIEEAVGETQVRDAELDLARQVIDSLVADFEPKELESVYRGNLRALLEAKLAGAGDHEAGAGRGRRAGDRPDGGAARVGRAGVEEVGAGEEAGAGAQDRRGRDVAQALNVVERYLLLGLRLGRHVDGFVDAYYGPPELAAQVDAEALVVRRRSSPSRPRRWRKGSTSATTRRTAWLRAQLLGCETSARRLAGEPITWAEEVERCYGVRPDPVPEEQLRGGARARRGALPGDGTLAERYQAWVESQTVPPEKLLAGHAGVLARAPCADRGARSGFRTTSRCTSRRSRTSRGRRSTTTSAAAGAASCSIRIGRSMRSSCRCSSRTRRTRATTPSTRGRRRCSSTGTATSRRRSSSSARRRRS